LHRDAKTRAVETGEGFSARSAARDYVEGVVQLFLAGLAASFAVTVSVFAVSAVMESVHYLLAGPSFERTVNLLLFIFIAGVSGAAAGFAFSLAVGIIGQARERDGPAR
jgi:hypothetical protein